LDQWVLRVLQVLTVLQVLLVGILIRMDLMIQLRIRMAMEYLILQIAKVHKV
jgi:hypothetical protein